MGEMCIRDRSYYELIMSVFYRKSISISDSFTAKRMLLPRICLLYTSMPRLSQAMKDVISCDKLRVGANDL